LFKFFLNFSFPFWVARPFYGFLAPPPPPPPRSLKLCSPASWFYIASTRYLLENYGPLCWTPDRVSLFPFGQLGTISISKYALHLFGTISSSYSTVILDGYFLLLFVNQSLLIIEGLCVFTDACDQVCSGRIWCWLQVLQLKKILMFFLLIILCSRNWWCNHHVGSAITLLKWVLTERRLCVDAPMLYPCNL